MSDKHERKAALASTKARLIKEGELYRVSVLHSKHMVAQALRPDELLHGAMDMAVGAVQARVAGMIGSVAARGAGGGGGGASTGIAATAGALMANYKRLMPLAISIGSFIQRRRLTKPAIGVGAAAALLGAWLYKRKQGGHS